MKRVAVTGATGFLGRRVVAELVTLGADVTATVRQPTNLPPGVRQVEVDYLKPYDGLYDKLNQPELLLDLAWGGLPNYSSTSHFETELPAHYRLIRELTASGLKVVIVVGTCLEYGFQSGCLSEDLSPQPSLAYPFAKDALRRQLGFLQEQVTFDLTWARLFYLWGTGQPKALFGLIEAAVQRGERSFAMSGGEQLRDYLHVDDAARLLARLSLAKPGNCMVNVSAGLPVSVRRLVETWREEFKWDIEFDLGRLPYPNYEPMAFWGDRRRLDSLLGN